MTLACILLRFGSAGLATDFDLSLKGSWPNAAGGYAKAVAITTRYAYVAADAAGLIVIDIRDPSNPQRVGAYDISGSAQGVAVSGNYAFVADAAYGLQVIDISNPTDPRWVGGYDTPGVAANVAIFGNFAYVADESAGIAVLDISNPANPQRVGGNSALQAIGVAAWGDYLFVAAGDQGLSILHTYRQGPPLSFAANAQVQADFFGFTVQGLPGIRVGVEQSNDLMNWQSWTNFILPPVPRELEQPGASTHPRQFYRAVVK